MVREYRTKVFKSGNSVALRLPKALGVQEGVEMIVREERGQFSFEPAEKPVKKIDLTGIWGSCPGMKTLTRKDREFEPSPRVWDDPDWDGWRSGDKQ